MAGTPQNTAKQLIDLYFGNKENQSLILSEVFHMAKTYEGKVGDMPNSYWVQVFIAIQDYFEGPIAKKD